MVLSEAFDTLNQSLLLAKLELAVALQTPSNLGQVT